MKLDYHKDLITLAFIVVVFTAIIIYLSYATYPSKVIINSKTFSVEVVDTGELLQKGLSGHKPLSQNEGMFFIFNKLDKYGFWMKDMTFPIDIIWIDETFKIVHIEKSVSPKTYPKVFSPTSPALYVLEIASGESSAIGMKIGDNVRFEKYTWKNL